MSDDHPISFAYDAGLAATDGGLRDPSVTPSGLSGGGTISDTMLFDGKLECSSCHDVHVPRNNNEGENCWGCHVIEGQWSTPPRSRGNNLSTEVVTQFSVKSCTVGVKQSLVLPRVAGS